MSDYKKNLIRQMETSMLQIEAEAYKLQEIADNQRKLIERLRAADNPRKG